MADFDEHDAEHTESGGGVATLTEGDVDDLFGEDHDAAETAEEQDGAEDEHDAGRSKAAGTAARPRAAAQFGWSEIESILSFVTAFEKGKKDQQAALKAALGFKKQDGLGVAQALYASTDIPVYRDATEFIGTVVAGKFDFMAAFSLVSELSKRDDEYVSRFFRAVNAFLKAEVRYRKSAALPDLLAPLASKAQETLKDDAQQTIQWIDGLLAVWPK